MEDDIDVYFMESSIPDVRSIEKKTRHNIETKKRELRTMVGAQYKDLISAADAIMNMNKNALIIKDNINHMQQTLHIYNQKDRLQLGDGQQKTEVDSKRKHIYLLAALVKALADVPEQIWHALENHNHIHASRLFTLSKVVYDYLIEEANSSPINISIAFPVIGKQWDAVSAFDTQIISRSLNHLRVTEQSSEHITETMVGLMLLDDLSYKDTLDRLLNIRFQLIHDTIHSPIKGADHPTSRILHQVKDIIMVIRKTMIQANEIFTRNENESTLIESYVSSFQQTFSIPSSTTNGTEIPNQPAVTRLFSPTSDVHLVMRYLPEAILKYTPQFEPAPLLPHGEVKSMILAWLQKVKYYIHDQLPSMMDSLDTEGQLTKIKNKIWETLYEDENTVRGGNKWQTSMQLLLDQQYSIWNSMFREIFIEKEKQIIDLGFIKLMEQPKFIIEPLLLNYSQSPLKEHSEISVDVWPPVASTGYNLLTLPSSSSSKEIITFHHALSRIAHDQVDILIQFQSSFDTLLDKLKQDIDTYTIPYENNLFQCSFDSVTIKSYFEDKCFDAVMNYTSGLKGLLKKAVELTDETKVNDISIIIGRLAKNIATLSTQLPKTLKIDNDTSTVYALYSSIDKDPKYAIIQNELMDVFHEAHTPWLNYLNRVFSKSLESILWTHNWDDQCPSFLIWENVMEDIKLPTQATNAVIRLVFSLCDQIQRVNSIMLNKTIIRRLKNEIITSVNHIYRSLIDDSAICISENGAIQLLFDLMMLNMVLKDNQHSVDEQLIKDTQGKVDPINWASYRPYLKPNVEKSFIRQSLIFGVLINSDDNIYESTRKLSASQQQGQYNILPMANQSARFTLLPIGHTMSSNLRSR